jgi:hypothetical protein
MKGFIQNIKNRKLKDEKNILNSKLEQFTVLTLPLCNRNYKALIGFYSTYSSNSYENSYRVKSSVSWNITPCGALKFNRRLGRTCCPIFKAEEKANQCTGSKQSMQS